MTAVMIIAASTIAIALLIAALSVPLILHKVPMNHFYGIRFRASFQSERNWYVINEYGGKALLIASLPIFISGLYRLIVRPSAEQVYLWFDFAVTMASFFTAFMYSLKKARDVEHNRA